MEYYISAFYENMCKKHLSWDEIWNIAFFQYLGVEFCIHLFLHNLGLLNAKLSHNMLYLIS